jgi:hypothetical protein
MMKLSFQDRKAQFVRASKRLVQEATTCTYWLEWNEDGYAIEILWCGPRWNKDENGHC